MTNNSENESDAPDGEETQAKPTTIVEDLFKMVAPEPDVTEEEKPDGGAPPRVTGD